MTDYKIPKVLETKTAYSGWLSIREDILLLPRTGDKQRYSVLEANDSVIVLPFTKKKEIIFTFEYRHPVGEWVRSLPSGRIEQGESAEDAARRELYEETGFSARTVELLCAGYPWVGISKMHTTCYLATDLEEGLQRQDANEDIKILRCPYEQVLEDVLIGREKNIQQVSWPIMAFALRRNGLSQLFGK